MPVKNGYSTQKAAEFLQRNGETAMKIVRRGVSVTLAYKIAKGEEIGDLDVLYRLYKSLKQDYPELTFFAFTGIE